LSLLLPPFDRTHLTGGKERQYIDVLMPTRSDVADAETTVAGIIQLANLITRKLAPTLRRYRVTPQQWTVLASVGQFESPPTMADISRMLLVSKQNITGMVARLEALDLVRRTEDPTDLRASRIQLSRKGERVAQSAGPMYQRWLSQTFADLSASERRALQKSITRLVATLS